MPYVKTLVIFFFKFSYLSDGKTETDYYRSIKQSRASSYVGLDYFCMFLAYIFVYNLDIVLILELTYTWRILEQD